MSAPTIARLTRPRRWPSWAPRSLGSIKEAANYGEAVFTMLADDAALEDVVNQHGRACSQSLPKGGIHICAGTHSVAITQKLKAAHAGAGQILIASPMLGRPEASPPARPASCSADRRRASTAAGRCSTAIARRTFEAGADPAAAAAIKIANNFVLGCAIEAMGEGFSLVRKYDVVPEVFYDVMTDGLFACSAYKVYGKIIAEERYLPAGQTRGAGAQGCQPRARRRRGGRRAAAERQRLARPPGRRRRPRRRRARLGGDGARAGARQRAVNLDGNPRERTRYHSTAQPQERRPTVSSGDRPTGRKQMPLLIAMLMTALALQLGEPARAQTWPQRPVTLIVSQSAGASPDVMARLITSKLAASLGQSFIVENKPGAGNVIGAQAAARAAPDGYTFFFATSAALVTNPYMLKNLSYDPVRDFVPVALVTRSHQVIVVHPQVPAKTLPELIALDKASPGKYSIAVDGPRNLAGVTAQALNKRAGTQFVLVPSVNINAGLQDTIAGRTQVGVFSASIVETHIRSGALRAVATASTRRLLSAPDIPATAETLPGFDFSGWFMIMAPAGTPAAIVNRLNAAVDQATRDPQVREAAPKLGFELDPNGVGKPEETAAFLKSQLALWAEMTKELGIEPQ